MARVRGPVTDRLSLLAAAVERERCAPRAGSRTARLLARGVPKMAQKVIEEAGEVSIEALRGDRAALVLESADLLYNLTVLWSELGIRPADVWAEMDRREALLGLAEKLPKPDPAEVP
ncbi:MAG: phosphoribosyl-ATP diphosphatase [Geminicoccaceae bacterium]